MGPGIDVQRRGEEIRMTNTQYTQPRLDYAKAAPGANAAMYGVERYVRECGLERGLLELVKLRASQINGLVSHEQVPDDVFEIARKVFSDKELVDLTMAVIAINGWNRLAISFRAVAGTYQPAPPQGGGKEA